MGGAELIFVKVNALAVSSAEDEAVVLAGHGRAVGRTSGRDRKIGGGARELDCRIIKGVTLDLGCPNLPGRGRLLSGILWSWLMAVLSGGGDVGGAAAVGSGERRADGTEETRRSGAERRVLRAGGERGFVVVQRVGRGRRRRCWSHGRAGRCAG